jgi:hypothetical protein
MRANSSTVSLKGNLKTLTLGATFPIGNPLKFITQDVAVTYNVIPCLKPNTEAKLAAAAAKITAKDLEGTGPKTAFVQFRVSEEEKASLQRTAESLGLQVSEYLLKLHALASANLKKR